MVVVAMALVVVVLLALPPFQKLDHKLLSTHYTGDSDLHYFVASYGHIDELILFVAAVLPCLKSEAVLPSPLPFYLFAK